MGDLRELLWGLAVCDRTAAELARELTQIPDSIAELEAKERHSLYTAAWMLLHFMVHADEGAHRDALTTLLRRIPTTEGSVAALESAFERPLEHIEPAWRAHVTSLR